MDIERELLAIEKSFWTDGPEAYHKNCDDTCLVVFSQMAELMDREAIAKTAEAGRWRDVSLTPVGVKSLSENAALLSYACSATRKDGKAHRAYASSAYVKRDRGWKLAFHQQTVI